jgi:16S rRNA (cytosine1407-C5)-methyltransferase
MKRKQKKTLPPISAEQFRQESLQRFRPLLDPQEFLALEQEIERPLLPTLRVNPLKSDVSKISEWAERYHWHVEVIPFCPSGFRIDDHEGTPVSQTPEHRLGHYYIQEAASMLPPELFSIDEADPGLTLDLAASPGGKTTHLVARTQDRGLVFANDSSQGRIPALRIVLQNWGAVNTAISQFPGEKLGIWFPELFDRALIDAPCSMQGLRTAESHTTRPVTAKESAALAKRQQALLSSALQAVKIGGQVVYSTCTLMPEEDEGVIDAILTRFGNAVKVIDVHTSLPFPAPGLTKADGQSYHPETAQSIRLWPHRLQTAGFFTCLLQKIDGIEAREKPAPARDLAHTGFQPCTTTEEQKFIHLFREQFTFDLETVLQEYHLQLVTRLNKVFVFPERVLSDFISLPLESTGMLLADETSDGWMPSHDWVCRFGQRFQAHRIVLEEPAARLWMNGEDLQGMIQSEKGTLVIVANNHGMILGRGKQLDDRLKNLLPRRLI